MSGPDNLTYFPTTFLPCGTLVRAARLRHRYRHRIDRRVWAWRECACVRVSVRVCVRVCVCAWAPRASKCVPANPLLGQQGARLPCVRVCVASRYCVSRVLGSADCAPRDGRRGMVERARCRSEIHRALERLVLPPSAAVLAAAGVTAAHSVARGVLWGGSGISILAAPPLRCTAEPPESQLLCVSFDTT
jgi:hypothetical protein